ncbi:Endophilin-B1, partial [Bulinus truncatus]
AESDLRVAQSEFDRQAEITKILLEGISSTHAHHLKCLNDFIEAQMTFFAQCQQYMADLQKQLGSYPVGGGPSNNNTSSSISLPAPSNPYSPPSIEVTAPTPTEKRQAKALYDYDAADSSELSLLADELIMVYRVQGLDPDWLMAERGSQRGKVPVTYLKNTQYFYEICRQAGHFILLYQYMPKAGFLKAFAIQVCDHSI